MMTRRVTFLIIVCVSLSSLLLAQSKNKPALPFTVDVLVERAAAGDLASVKAYVAAGGSVDEWDSRGRLALAVAAENGRTEVAKYLIGLPHDSDKGFNEALQAALSRGNAEIAEACWNVMQKAAPAYRDTLLGRLATSGSIDAMRFLIDRGLDVNRGRKGDPPPLVFAVKASKVEALKLLVSKGADVNCRDELGRPVIFMALDQEDPDVIKELLSAKPKLNVYDRAGATPLTYAAEVDGPDIVTLLLRAGARSDLPNKAGKTALDVARENRNDENVTILQSKPGPKHPVQSEPAPVTAKEKRWMDAFLDTWLVRRNFAAAHAAIVSDFRPQRYDPEMVPAAFRGLPPVEQFLSAVFDPDCEGDCKSLAQCADSYRVEAKRISQEEAAFLPGLTPYLDKEVISAEVVLHCGTGVLVVARRDASSPQRVVTIFIGPGN
jgi:ankyrin repeat protein